MAIWKPSACSWWKQSTAVPFPTFISIAIFPWRKPCDIVYLTIVPMVIDVDHNLFLRCTTHFLFLQANYLSVRRVKMYVAHYPKRTFGRSRCVIIPYYNEFIGPLMASMKIITLQMILLLATYRLSLFFLVPFYWSRGAAGSATPVRLVTSIQWSEFILYVAH
jgi:hypothetical protein